MMIQNCEHMSIGMKAPDFTAVTTMGPIKMSDLKGKWVVFFSHPGDFTQVIKDKCYRYCIYLFFKCNIYIFFINNYFINIIIYKSFLFL